jgi:hypothetical protein
VQKAAYAKAEIDWQQRHQQRKETWRQRQAEELDWHKRKSCLNCLGKNHFYSPNYTNLR